MAGLQIGVYSGLCRYDVHFLRFHVLYFMARGTKDSFPQMIANFFFGIGSMLIFSMATTMLTEFMPKKASSGVALNNFMRNIFSCVGSLVTAPIIDAIGNGWLFTILGIVAFLSSSVLFAMKVFGPRWRKSMDALRH